MSDQIKHECGLAVVRLLRPLSYYQEKYGSALYGINKMHILMQKMRNRGQNGAGIATIKIGAEPGSRYISRKRSNDTNAIKKLFDGIYHHFNNVSPENLKDGVWLKNNLPYAGELLMGHLRYGTHGSNSIEHVHPFHRQSNYMNRNLILAGNFNLTNVDELFNELVQLGQYPKEKSDTVTMLEKIGHFLDDEVQRLHTWFKPDGHTNEEINDLIFDQLDVHRLLRRASKKFDGGFVMGGMIGHGDAFVMRDPNGIRPAYVFQDDEVVVIASERPAIQTAFNVHKSRIHELAPGHAIVIKHNGTVINAPYIDAKEKTSCSFERIYFSRGTDSDIYLERKKLGEQLAKRVMASVDFDIKNTVFSYVPNTAESAFFGLMEGIHDLVNEWKKERIIKLGKNGKLKKIEKILAVRPRMEKLVIKDEKLRTFIADASARGEMVSHVYDVTYGIVQNDKDTLVLLDDSIVRGTTLRDSIINIVSRLRPKKIVIVSSAPQIRYPDCYGIDMSKMKEFVAFQALVKLLGETKRKKLLKQAYELAKKQEALPAADIVNVVVPLYDLFTDEEISKKIAQIITPEGIKPEVEVIYQTVTGLHTACPNDTGDWYFTGNYPTKGGNRVVNRAFINYMENNDERSY